MVLLLVLVFNQGVLSIDYQEAVETPTSVGNLACTDLEPQWLLAQSVPSASLVPCLRSLPAGWMVGQVTVNDGRSVIPLNHDRAGTDVLVVRLTAACDIRGATQVSLRPAAGAALPADRSPGAALRGHPLRPVPGRLCHRPGGRAGGQPGRGHQPAGHDPATTPPGRPSSRRWTSARMGDCGSTHPLLDHLDNPRSSFRSGSTYIPAPAVNAG